MRDGKEQEGHRQNLPQIAKLWQILPITLKRKMKKKKKEKKGYRNIPENGRGSFCTKWSKMEFRIRPELAQSFATSVGTFQQQQLFAIGLGTY